MQAALEKIVVLAGTNNLFIKDVSQSFSVGSTIDLTRQKSFADQVGKMNRDASPEYTVNLTLHMGRFEPPQVGPKGTPSLGRDLLV